ncbi:MAG: hypothetical protein JWN44_1930 [Myxococcales bacterium]|nr:hypothetical protein [Myxococcales bacterium]
MPQAAEKKDKDEPEVKAEPQQTREKKDAPEAEAGAAAEGEAKGGETEKKKEQGPPQMTLSNPSSGAAYAADADIGLNGEVTAGPNEEVKASYVIHDAEGKVVNRFDAGIQTNAEGKGLVAGIFSPAAMKLGAGKYSMHYFAAGMSGASPIQKIEFELVDEGKAEEEIELPAGAEGDPETIETKGGGV